MSQSGAQSTAEKWWEKSKTYAVNSDDALVALIAKGFETILVLSKTTDEVRADHALASLDNERKLAMQFETKEFDMIRDLSFGLIESLQVLLGGKRMVNEDQNQILVDEAPNSTLAILMPKEEQIDHIDPIPERNKAWDDFLVGEGIKQEIDVHFDADNAILPAENPMNELPSDEHSDVEIVHSDMMKDDVNPTEDTIVDKRTPTMMEEESLNDRSSIGENIDDSAQNEMIGESIDLMDQVEKEKTFDHTIDTPKDSVETGGVEKGKRPTITLSRPARFTESIDESEPQVKKQRSGEEHLKKITMQMIAPLYTAAMLTKRDEMKSEKKSKEKEQEEREKREERRRSRGQTVMSSSKKVTKKPSKKEQKTPSKKKMA